MILVALIKWPPTGYIRWSIDIHADGLSFARHGVMNSFDQA